MATEKEGFPLLEEFMVDYSTRAHHWRVFDAEQTREWARALADLIDPYTHGDKGTGDFINENLKPAYRELARLAEGKEKEARK